MIKKIRFIQNNPVLFLTYVSMYSYTYTNMYIRVYKFNILLRGLYQTECKSIRAGIKYKTQINIDYYFHYERIHFKPFLFFRPFFKCVLKWRVSVEEKKKNFRLNRTK